MKDHRKAEAVNEITALAKQYALPANSRVTTVRESGTQQLRERMSGALLGYLAEQNKDTQQENLKSNEKAATTNPLADAINAVWAKLYGGEPVTDVAALVSRINLIAADRNCWVANAKSVQAEYLKFEEKIKLLNAGQEKIGLPKPPPLYLETLKSSIQYQFDDICPTLMQDMVSKICELGNIRGLADPMFVANILAEDLGFSSGFGNFTAISPITLDQAKHAAEKLRNTYPHLLSLDHINQIVDVLIIGTTSIDSQAAKIPRKHKP